MRVILASTLFLISFCLQAQNDPQAAKVLDSFSSKATSAPSVSMKFSLITVDQTDNSSDTITGSVILSGNKYKLDLPENTIFFNGQTSWSYLPGEKEVTVTNVDKKDDSFMSRPASVFSMYKKGYKSRLIEEASDSYIIDLYPEDIKSELIRIRLTVGKSQLDLRTLEYKRRDGVTATLYVKEYNLKNKVSPDTFTFNKEKYKGVEVVDMR